ncbi:unnamed protein product [Mytilus coruscus]|uniref:Uncharacterized protein n=1 Tax=Mytilus coruscus TaxID=42192 RepID=A0A6J8C7S9_MYTCO|nr:unnamed protein product [Mytilus coruscus]
MVINVENSVKDTSYSDTEPPASLNVQSGVYSFRERKLNSSIFELGLNLDSQLSASTQSDNLSQISTWSDEMDTSLDDINSTIQTISKGSISPLKCTCSKKGEFFRQRLDQDKLAHALEFFFNPTFNQVCSFGTRDLKLQNGEVIQIPDVVRTLCHSTFNKTHLAFCKESEFQPLSMSIMYKILQSCPA